MDEHPPKPANTREQRLAAQLRANLRRRKAQARLKSSSEDNPVPAPVPHNPDSDD